MIRASDDPKNEPRRKENNGKTRRGISVLGGGVGSKIGTRQLRHRKGLPYSGLEDVRRGVEGQ